MAGRSKKPETNRHEFHSARVKAARKAKSPKSELWAYCQWLVPEAWQAGPEEVEQAIEMVRERIEALTRARKEGTTR